MSNQNTKSQFNSAKELLNKVKQNLAKHELLLVVVMLFVVAFLAYGIYLNDLGFYWDDWGVFWLEQNLGAQGVIDGHMIDRPAIGYNHALLSLLFGRNISLYHYYAFALRLLGAYGFLWLLRLIWPDQRFFSTIMTVLFLVYPGFLSQPIAYTKTNHLTAILLLLISFIFTVLGLRAENKTKRFLFWFVSLLTGIAYYFYFEYLLGFEVVRLGLIGYMTWWGSETNKKQKIVRIFRAWLPFFLVICVYLYWRVYVFESSRPTVNVDSLIASYTGGIGSLRQYLTLFFDLLIDYLELIVFVWFVPAFRFTTTSVLRPLGTALVLGLITAGLVIAYYWAFLNQRNEQDKDESSRIRIQWVVIGLVTLVITNFLPVFAGREFKVLTIFKSYGLHIGISASILLVGLLHIIISSRYRALVVAGLVFLAVTAHNLNSKKMVEYWEAQQELWWQLSWRAPDLRDGTVLWVRLSEEIGYEQDYEIWGPANLIYSETSDSPRILGEVFYTGTLPMLQGGFFAEDNFRLVPLQKDYEYSLVMTIPSPASCLTVYDGNKLEFSEFADPLVQLAAAYSQIELVLTDNPGHIPPESIFGPEPEHRWCYYFQKASLARQVGDWEEVLRMLDEAEENGYRANDHVEWMPFFEAYVNLGMYEEAKGLASILRSDRNMVTRLCENLPEDPGYPGSYDYEKINELLCQ